MIMSQDQLNFIASVYNRLMMIEAKGDNLLCLASVINDLLDFIITEQLKIRKENKNGKIVSPTD